MVRKLSLPTVLLIIIFGYQTAVLTQSTQTSKSARLISQMSEELQALTERVAPAIVRILVSGYVPIRGNEGSGANLLSKQRSAGSGVILDPDGYIVTNAHVVEGARRIQVILAELPDASKPGRSILKARGKTVGAQIAEIDPETDLAVLKVQEKGLPYLNLGDSDKLGQGELVMAFGSPLGLENSVTLGVVSALARQFRPEDPMIYIQTDAPINPGSSGGPLVDIHGNVVGINTFILTQSGGNEGIGFAAPSNIVRNVFEQIRNTGRVRRGEIGVHAQTVTPLLAAGLGLPRVWGVVVADVLGGPAHQAGLKIGDMILTLDGKVMENGRQFDVNLYGYGSRERAILEVLRGSDTLSVAVDVIERPDDPSRFLDLVSPEKNLIPELGILGLDVDENIARMLPRLRLKSGVVVASRSANALYFERDGFQLGDVIHGINNKKIKNLTELRSVLKEINIYDPVVAQIERHGQFRYVAFELESSAW